jgi:hypothetical protein
MNFPQGELMKRALTLLPALVVLVCSLAVAQSNQQPERFTANAVSLSPEYGTGQQVVDIDVTRWSSNAERERLVAALREKGPNELLKQLQKVKPVGRIKTPDSLGYDLRYAYQQVDPDGGRTIVIATDRPIGFWEASNRPRSIDYPFTVIQMQLDREGTGKGTMSYATRIVAHENNVIELEDFATQPIMLNNIKSEPKNATK